MDIDVYDPDNYTHGIPHEQFRWLRDNAPVHWHEHPEGYGYWVLSRHEDVIRVSRDHQTFSAQRGFVLVDDLPEDIASKQGQLTNLISGDQTTSDLTHTVETLGQDVQLLIVQKA